MSHDVLVTGADGFIGSHLVELLVRQGYGVRAFCMYNSFNRKGWLDTVSKDVLGEVDVVLGDIRDTDMVDLAVKGCDHVLHLAALIGIPYSYSAPTSYIDTNITGTVNVLNAARRHGVRRVVHTSTSEVYGSAQFVPITEEHPLNAQSPYAATKIAADQMALSYHRAFDVPVAVLRPFNTYGPRQSMRAVIPTVIMQVLSGKSEIELGSTAPTRDFSFVTDTASGFVAAMKADGAVGAVTNVGSGFEISIADMVALVGDILGAPITVRSASDRVRPPSSEVDRLWADTTRAKTEMNWQPEHAGLEGFRRGLEKTISWFQKDENQCFYVDSGYTI